MMITERQISYGDFLMMITERQISYGDFLMMITIERYDCYDLV